MSERFDYPPGVPCWVDTLQPDPVAAVRFYSELFAWNCIGPGPMPGEPPGEYFVARLKGLDVAGIGSKPPQASQAQWSTYVSVADADASCLKVRRAGGTILVMPFDALPAGRAAVVSDPSGASFCLWESRDRKGAQRVNESNAWAMSSLMTRNPDACVQFYRAVFGWETQAFEGGPTGIVLLRLPGYGGGEPQQPVSREVIAVMVDVRTNGVPESAPAHWNVDFWVANAEETAGKAKELHATVLAPPHDTPGFRRCIIADPQGAVFSISQLTRR